MASSREGKFAVAPSDDGASEWSSTLNDDNNLPRGAGSKQRKPLKLTDSQRERKRAIDREAQRNIRNKTKNYITYLENLVKATQGGDGSESGGEDRTKWLLNQLQQSQDETRRLREMVSGVQKLLGGNNGDGSTSSIATVFQPSAATAGSRGDAAGSICTNVDDTNDDMDEAHDSNEPAESPTNHELVPAHPTAQQQDPQPFPYFHQDGALFYFAREQLVLSLVAGARPASTAIEDDDIAIRAVLHGWRTVEDFYDLDLGWRALKQIDQVIFSLCGILERVSILRSMRRTWLHQLHDPDLRLVARAPFMNVEISQTGRSPAVPQMIDHFAWPGLREAFYQAPHRYVTTSFAQAFQNNFCFIWPFEVADAYTKDPISALYACSSEFASRQADLNCWTMRGDFFSGRRELYNAIRSFDGSISRTLMPGGRLMIQASPTPYSSARSPSNASFVSDADNEAAQNSGVEKAFAPMTMPPSIPPSMPSNMPPNMIPRQVPMSTWVNLTEPMQEDANMWSMNMSTPIAIIPQARHHRAANPNFIG